MVRGFSAEQKVLNLCFALRYVADVLSERNEKLLNSWLQLLHSFLQQRLGSV